MPRRGLRAEILRKVIFFIFPLPFRKEKNQERKASREETRGSWRTLHKDGWMSERSISSYGGEGYPPERNWREILSGREEDLKNKSREENRIQGDQSLKKLLQQHSREQKSGRELRIL